MLGVVKGFVCSYDTGHVFDLAYKQFPFKFPVEHCVFHFLGIFNIDIPQVLGFCKIQVKLCLCYLKQHTLNPEDDLVQFEHKEVGNCVGIGKLPQFKLKKGCFISLGGCYHLGLQLYHIDFPFLDGGIGCCTCHFKFIFPFLNIQGPLLFMVINQGLFPFNLCHDESCFCVNFPGLGGYDGFMSLYDTCLSLDQSGIGSFYLYLGLFQSGLSCQQGGLCITHGFNAWAGLILNTAYGEYTQY